jgi:hypothetical protein
MMQNDAKVTTPQGSAGLYKQRVQIFLPNIARDRLHWYAHNSAHEYPMLTSLRSLSLSGIFHRLLLLVYDAEVVDLSSLSPLAMPWKQIDGGLARISAGSVTSVWGVNSGDNIFRYTGDDSKAWIQIPGALTDIGAAADGTVWGVNRGGDIFRYTWDSTHWKKIPGALKRISAGSRTNVWGVNAAGNIFRYTGDDSNPW